MEAGDEYQCKQSGKKCVIHRLERRGRGFTVVYLWHGFKYGLMTGKTEFLKRFNKV